MLTHIAVAVPLLLPLLLWYVRPATRWRIRALIKESRRSYSKKEHGEALQQVEAARELAVHHLGESSSVHARVLVHLAGAHNALGAHDKAIEALQYALSLAAKRKSVTRRIRLLQAMAEVREAADQPTLALEALDAARQLQKERFGADSLQYGGACFTHARALVRHANDSTALTNAQREALVAEAVRRSIEASDSFDAAYMSHEGDENVEMIVEAIETGGDPNRLASLPGCAAPVKELRERLKEHQTYFGDDAMTT